MEVGTQDSAPGWMWSREKKQIKVMLRYAPRFLGR